MKAMAELRVRRDVLCDVLRDVLCDILCDVLRDVLRRWEINLRACTQQSPSAPVGDRRFTNGTDLGLETLPPQ